MGTQLAIAEARIVLSALLSNYRMRLVEQGEINPTPAISLRPSTNVSVDLAMIKA